MDIKRVNESNTLEIMEFRVGTNVYGINVAKVREVVQYSEPLPSPDQNPCVEGILMLRGKPVPIIDLATRLGMPKEEDTERNLFIIANFNKLVVGFHVHEINGIRRLSWADINSPDETISRYNNCIITGIVNLKECILVLLDFEKIVADINPSTTIRVSDVKTTADEKNVNKPIMVVDDSQMLNKLICSCLTKAGYTNIISFSNGQDAWDSLMQVEDKSKIREVCSAIISDIEMPVMDGLTLCSKIKSDNFLRLIPVILFSSIIDEAMARKCDEVGANANLSKPGIDRLVSILETYLS